MNCLPHSWYPWVAIAGEVQTAKPGHCTHHRERHVKPGHPLPSPMRQGIATLPSGPVAGRTSENGVDESQAHRRRGRLRTGSAYRHFPNRLPLFVGRWNWLDWTGERDLETLREHISHLGRADSWPFEGAGLEDGTSVTGTHLQATFTPIKPGGQREPLIYEPKGYFVMTLDRSEGQIILRHYLPDHTPAHEMRGRTTESMLLGLIREGLVSQLSHAGLSGERACQSGGSTAPGRARAL